LRHKRSKSLNSIKRKDPDAPTLIVKKPKEFKESFGPNGF
jgi:hypothetical protein